MWYPAKVNAILVNGKISVTYPEYGNSEEVTPDRIRPLPTHAPAVGAPAPAAPIAAPAPKFKVGDVVEAKFSEDGVWYAASITEVHPTGQFQVTYPEYGNSELLGEDSIRPAPSKSNGAPAAPAKKSVNPPPGFASQPLGQPLPQAHSQPPQPQPQPQPLAWGAGPRVFAVPPPGVIGGQPRMGNGGNNWNRLPQQPGFPPQGYPGFPPQPQMPQPQQQRGGPPAFGRQGGSW